MVHIVYMFKLNPSPEYIAFRTEIDIRTFIYVFAIFVGGPPRRLRRRPGWRGSLTKGVHSTDDVRGELVAIFATVAADVALQGVSVAVAAHVDGVHDVI